MQAHLDPWTIGVEEEYQIIDPHTRELAPAVDHILSYIEPTYRANVQHELQLSQIEISTPVCHDLAEVRDALINARQQVISAATQAHYCIAASGTHPFSHWSEQSITPHQRYFAMERQYQQLAREQIILGCHIHVGCRDRALALQIVNRARLWLAPLLALSANSPYWSGHDTGYDSYRSEIWWRWPMAGPPPYLATETAYDQIMAELIQTRHIEDTTHVYWDIRLSERFPTIEFRVTDVCMTIDETVMLTGLIRALVQTCAEQALEQQPFRLAPNELLKAAHWQAARYGLSGDLVDLSTSRVLSATQYIDMFLSILRPALQSQNSWQEVSSLVERTLREGNGATRQRKVFRETEQYQSVVDFIVQETARGVTAPLAI